MKKTKLYLASSVLILGLAITAFYFSSVLPALGVGTTNPTPQVSLTEDNTFSGDVTLASTTITGTTTLNATDVIYPTSSSSVATKGYVDVRTLNYTTGISSKSAASGGQTIAHGLGEIPLMIKITAYAQNSSQNGTKSFATFDGTTYGLIWTGDDSSIQQGSRTDSIVYLYQNISDSMSATASLDSTNISLTWTKVGDFSPTLVFLWEAWGNLK